MLARLLMLIAVLLLAGPGYAETMVFEKEVEEVVANDQSREQVEAFALQKAKRLAVEEAGTYISSLMVVVNSALARDEITALASGVVQAKIVSLPNVRLENGVVHVTVKARIQVDTGILDKQVAELLKEKGAVKKLEAEQKKVRELEDKLASLKSSELKRLEELNAQAVVLEQERERRRMANAEMALKAQGELKQAEVERLRKDRDLQDRTAKMLAEQEAQRSAEVAALAREQDRIRRAQLENEQRWNDLARKSRIAQQQWVAIDDSLSLKQALEEVKTLKGEITTLKQRSEFQYQESIKTLKSAYEQQLAATSAKMPPPLTEKDPFESTAEYNARVTAHEEKVGRANEENTEKIDKLRGEENLKLAQAKLSYLEQQVKVLRPFIERLQALQARRFVLPGEPVTVELGVPDADRSCFPTTITHKDEQWTVDWQYSDPKKARDIYSTRSRDSLKAEAMVRLADSRPEGYVMTEARVTHLGTGEQQRLTVAEPQEFDEIAAFGQTSNGELAGAKEETEKATKLAKYRKNYRDPASGMELILVQGIYELFYMGKYEVTQGQWENIMGNNPSKFITCGAKCPVENVSLGDAKQFIERLNQKSTLKYRLPTGEEWEFACTSGGKHEKYCGGSDLDSLAWYKKNSGDRTHEVGTKQPNGLGIFDMSGNVAEHTSDTSPVFHHDIHIHPRGGDFKRYARPASDRDTERSFFRKGTLGIRLIATVD